MVEIPIDPVGLERKIKEHIYLTKGTSARADIHFHEGILKIGRPLRKEEDHSDIAQYHLETVAGLIHLKSNYKIPISIPLRFRCNMRRALTVMPEKTFEEKVFLPYLDLESDLPDLFVMNLKPLDEYRSSLVKKTSETFDTIVDNLLMRGDARVMSATAFVGNSLVEYDSGAGNLLCIYHDGTDCSTQKVKKITAFELASILKNIRDIQPQQERGFNQIVLRAEMKPKLLSGSFYDVFLDTSITDLPEVEEDQFSLETEIGPVTVYLEKDFTEEIPAASWGFMMEEEGLGKEYLDGLIEGFEDIERVHISTRRTNSIVAEIIERNLLDVLSSQEDICGSYLISRTGEVRKVLEDELIGENLMCISIDGKNAYVTFNFCPSKRELISTMNETRYKRVMTILPPEDFKEVYDAVNDGKHAMEKYIDVVTGKYEKALKKKDPRMSLSPEIIDDLIGQSFENIGFIADYLSKFQLYALEGMEIVTGKGILFVDGRKNIMGANLPEEIAENSSEDMHLVDLLDLIVEQDIALILNHISLVGDYSPNFEKSSAFDSLQRIVRAPLLIEDGVNYEGFYGPTYIRAYHDFIKEQMTAGFSMPVRKIGEGYIESLLSKIM